MKNIRLFENFSENEEQSVDKQSIFLRIVFGNDQANSVENILDKLQDEKHVVDYKTESVGQKSKKYLIHFTSPYGIYLFGHKQGALRVD